MRDRNFCIILRYLHNFKILLSNWIQMDGSQTGWIIQSELKIYIDRVYLPKPQVIL